jgi:hypothetical protein
MNFDIWDFNALGLWILDFRYFDLDIWDLSIQTYGGWDCIFQDSIVLL